MHDGEQSQIGVTVANPTKISTPGAEFRVEGRPESVAEIRALVTATLTGWSLEHLIPDGRLIASELGTNAIEATPGQDVRLLPRHEGTSISIGVWDSSNERPIAGSGDVLATSGRGLLIVADIADEHGCRPVDNPRGKIVWARLKI